MGVKMINYLKTNLIVILSTLLLVSAITNSVLLIVNHFNKNEIEKLNVQLGVVAGLSQNQKVKIVESKVIEEKIKVVTQDRLKMIKEYVPDENKSDCENGADIIRSTF